MQFSLRNAKENFSGRRGLSDGKLDLQEEITLAMVNNNAFERLVSKAKAIHVLWVLSYV